MSFMGISRPFGRFPFPSPPVKSFPSWEETAQARPPRSGQSPASSARRSGSILFQGIEIHRLPPHRVVAMGLSQVPEGRRIFPRMSVLENLHMGSHLPDARKRRPETLTWIFQLFPILKERKEQFGGTLSGGEQQMLAIARGLMCRPKLLLLDEFSLGLAPLMVKEIFGIIAEINKHGTTVFLVEQNVQKSLCISHRGYVLENGSIVLRGEGPELLKNPYMMKAFLGM